MTTTRFGVLMVLAFVILGIFEVNAAFPYETKSYVSWQYFPYDRVKTEPTHVKTTFGGLCYEEDKYILNGELNSNLGKYSYYDEVVVSDNDNVRFDVDDSVTGWLRRGYDEDVIVMGWPGKFNDDHSRIFIKSNAKNVNHKSWNINIVSLKWEDYAFHTEIDSTYQYIEVKVDCEDNIEFIIPKNRYLRFYNNPQEMEYIYSKYTFERYPDIQEMPSNLTVEEYEMTYNLPYADYPSYSNKRFEENRKRKVKVNIDEVNKKVYIAGLFSYNCTSVMEGTIDDTGAWIFPCNQYAGTEIITIQRRSPIKSAGPYKDGGIKYDDDHWINTSYLKSAEFVSAYFDDYYVSHIWTANIDTEPITFVCADSSDAMVAESGFAFTRYYEQGRVATNTMRSDGYRDYGYYDVQLRKARKGSQKPAKPFADETDWTHVMVMCRANDVDGYMIDKPENLYLSVFVNGEPICINGKTEVQLNEINYWYYVPRDENNNPVNFEAETIYYYEGQRIVSDRFKWTGKGSDIDSVGEKVLSEDTPVYDLYGRVVKQDNLAPGIYIKNGKKFVCN